MDPLNRELLQIGFDAGDDLGLVLAGGYALVAHEMVDRTCRDIGFATETALQLARSSTGCLLHIARRASLSRSSRARRAWRD